MRSTQNNLSLFLAFLLAITAFAGLLAVLDRATPGGSLPTPTPPPPPVFRTPSPVLVEPNRRQSVVLLSLGGANATTLADWMAGGVMPALSRLATQGWAAPLHSISPPLPGPALNALATGDTSAHTTSIWQTAAEHQRTTALLFWPDAGSATPDRRADYTLACAPPPTAAGEQKTILSPADPWPGIPAGFSPPYAGTITLPSSLDTAAWNVLAVDTLDDGQATYDTFFLQKDRDQPAVDENTLRLARDSWETLPAFGRAAPGLMLTVTGVRTVTGTTSLTSTTGVTPTNAITPTAPLSPTTATPLPLLELVLYQIAARPVAARPATLGQQVIQHFGFCPPLPDPGTVARGQLSPVAFQELASSRARWTMRVAAHVYETYRPHLLMVRQEALLASQQALLLTDARQPGYSPARAIDFADHRRTVAAAIDGGLDDLLATVDLNYATVLIVSEHGMAPVHTRVNITAALQRLAPLQEDELPGNAPPRVHVEGAFLSVEVGSAGSAATRTATLRLLSSLEDPHTGQSILVRVTRRENAGSWAQAWPYPGDVLAQAAPGYALSAAQSTTSNFSNPQVYGLAGHDARLPDIEGMLIAAGRDISATQPGDIVSLLDVAPNVAAQLGIPSPTKSP